MTESSGRPEEALAFLHELLDRYGVEELTARLATGIQEAEAGRVAGPGLEEAAAWLEKEHGPRIAAFAGEGRLTLSASAAGAMFAGTGSLTLTAGTTGEAVVHKLVEDVVKAADQAAITVTETAQVVVTQDLPTNMQVIAQVHEMFWYLLNAWSLTQVPSEVIPFALLLALAIVVTRIRVKQARG